MLQIIVSIILAFSFFCRADESSTFMGRWQFTSYIYQGHEIPAPNPLLKMYFDFEPDETTRLYYKRDDETGFCERRAKFQLDEGVLYQKVIWVNPDNASNCSTDTDMKMGQESYSKVSITNGRFYLDIPLSDEMVTFIWTKVAVP